MLGLKTFSEEMVYSSFLHPIFYFNDYAHLINNTALHRMLKALFPHILQKDLKHMDILLIFIP